MKENQKKWHNLAIVSEWDLKRDNKMDYYYFKGWETSPTLPENSSNYPKNILYAHVAIWCYNTGKFDLHNIKVIV